MKSNRLDLLLPLRALVYKHGVLMSGNEYNWRVLAITHEVNEYYTNFANLGMIGTPTETNAFSGLDIAFVYSHAPRLKANRCTVERLNKLLRELKKCPHWLTNTYLQHPGEPWFASDLFEIYALLNAQGFLKEEDYKGLQLQYELSR